jgi:hypothetical protein
MILPVAPQPPERAPGSFLQILGLIWFALLAGQLAFLGIVFVVSRMASTPGPPDPQLHEVFRFLVPATAVMVVALSHGLYPRLVDASRRKETLQAKLANYQQASIAKWALIEVGGLFSIVAYLMTSRILYLAVFAAGLAVYMLARPSRHRTVRELELPPADRAALDSTSGQRA